MTSDYIESDPLKFSGRPVFKGTRFPISQFFAELAEGRTIQDLSDGFGLEQKMLEDFLHSVAEEYAKSKVLQPDLHHEGPLTLELIEGLLEKLIAAHRELIDFRPTSDPYRNWEDCKNNWFESLHQARLRCAAIIAKLKIGIDYRSEEDHKCVDIMLCILRDFEFAKSVGFRSQ
jgi:uncharacterized protein (DUF433 family)